MCASMVDIPSATAEIRRRKKKKIEDRNHRANVMSASAIRRAAMIIVTHKSWVIGHVGHGSIN